MPLEPEDRHLRAAEGYLELGMPVDANQELEQIEPDGRHTPEVLTLRLGIYRTLQKWDQMQLVASKLAKNDPDEVQRAVSWAYATRRAESTEAATRILLHALERHGREAVLHFNLALLRVPARGHGRGEATAAGSVHDRCGVPALDP